MSAAVAPPVSRPLQVRWLHAVRLATVESSAASISNLPADAGRDA